MSDTELSDNSCENGRCSIYIFCIDEKPVTYFENYSDAEEYMVLYASNLCNEKSYYFDSVLDGINIMDKYKYYIVSYEYIIHRLRILVVDRHEN